MTNHNTKKSLKASGLALFVCIAMLIGTTFAWFTDSITNSGNKIESGNLDITFEEWDGTKYVDASKTPIFNYKKWEPGYTDIAAVKIANEGTLALKYQIDFISGNATADSEKLAEAIEVYYKDDANAENGMPKDLKGFDKIGTLADFLDNKDNAATGTLKANGNADYAMVALHMPESAGNDVQNLSTGAFDIVVSATQLNSEEDGFGNPDYDEDATLPTTPGNFEEALNEAKPGDVIKLSSGTFKMPSANYDIPDGVSIVGDGNTTIALNSGNPSDTTTAGMLISNDNVTLKDVKVTGKSMGSKDYNAYIRITGDNVTLDNVTIDALYTVVSPIRIDSTGADNEITIKNSNIYSTSGRAVYIVDGANGTVNIENTEITGVYPISVNSGSSKELVLNVSDSKLHGWISYGDIKSASFKNTEFSQGDSSYEFIRPYVDTTFTDCTFVDGFKVGAGATGKTYTFNNCTSAGVKLTAINIQEKLLDMSGSDETNLKGCTMIVDGVSMTPGQ